MKPVNPLTRNPDERRSGRTTRLVDMYIQQLFDSETENIIGSVVVHDHYCGQSFQDHIKASERLIQIIVRRLAMEHQHVNVTVDKKKLTITIQSKQYKHEGD